MKRKNMYRNVGGIKIHVNQLAANSRKFSVSNNTIPKLGLNKKNIITNWKEIRTSKFDTSTRGKMFEIDKDGHYHLIEIDHSWKEQHYPQPKSYWMELNEGGKPTLVKSVSLHKNPKRLNKVEYMEKLVEHKTAKWERKNPKPADMFTEEVEKWNQLRATAIERFRDFVISIYDPLLLTGRFVMSKKPSATYIEEKVADIKDINGEGHRVNELPKTSKLMKKVQKITNETKAKRPNLIATNLRDHKKQKGRIILPEAA